MPRPVLPSGLALPRRGLFFLGLTGPAAAQPAGPGQRAAILDRLRFAAGVLCPSCDNDIEAEGINRPMRRVILAGSALDAAEAVIDLAEGRYRAALPSLRRARTALESLDESAAAQAIRRAIRIIEAMRTGA